MIFPKAEASLPKGHLRCFTCRTACLLRNGAWQFQDNQQVFVCLKCKHVAPGMASKLVTAIIK